MPNFSSHIYLALMIESVCILYMRARRTWNVWYRFSNTTFSSGHCTEIENYVFFSFKYLHCYVKIHYKSSFIKRAFIMLDRTILSHSFLLSIIEWELVLINLDLEQIQLNLISRLLVDQDFLCQLGNWLLSSFRR